MSPNLALLSRLSTAPVGRKKGPTAWIRKAIIEHAKGKRVVLVYPIDKWVLMILRAVGVSATVRNLGDVRWHAIEDGTPGKGTGRHIACFILEPLMSVTTAGRDVLALVKDERETV